VCVCECVCVSCCLPFPWIAARESAPGEGRKRRAEGGGERRKGEAAGLQERQAVGKNFSLSMFEQMNVCCVRA